MTLTRNNHCERGSKQYVKPASDVTATAELAKSPTTDVGDDIVVSLSVSFQLDFVVQNASDAFVPDSKK